MKNYKENWKRYMQAWAETDREKMLLILKDALSTDCSYLDPVTEQTVVGYQAIQAYIEQTQKMVPGVNLQLAEYEQHHNTSLAQWNMCDGNGNIIAPGKSFTRYNGEGKIVETVAFFRLPV